MTLTEVWASIYWTFPDHAKDWHIQHLSDPYGKV